VTWEIRTSDKIVVVDGDDPREVVQILRRDVQPYATAVVVASDDSEMLVTCVPDGYVVTSPTDPKSVSASRLRLALLPKEGTT
jgi:hypothetical protein